MKKLFSLLLYGAALTASAQTDVTATYLKNYGFDTGFHYKAGATNEVKQEIKPITGWTAGFTVDYTTPASISSALPAPTTAPPCQPKATKAARAAHWPCPPAGVWR